MGKAELENLLYKNNGEFVSEVVRLYALDELEEMNETYQTAEYCPGFITIGDDSGGRAIICDVECSGPLYIVGHGAMTPDCFEKLAPNLAAWKAMKFALPD
jgi:hypothetical protein